MHKRTINPLFPAKLKELREECNLSQHELAEMSGVPVRTIQEYEQGRREPLFSAMQKLAGALEADLNDFPSPVE